MGKVTAFLAVAGIVAAFLAGVLLANGPPWKLMGTLAGALAKLGP